MPKLRGSDFDELARRARWWDRQAILLQPVDVKFDRFADQPQDFLASLAHRQTPWQIRDMCAPTRFAPLDDHDVTHHRHAYFSFLRPACLSMAFKVPGGIQAGLGGNRDRARLGRVFVLPVTAASSRQPPAIILEKSDQLSDFHGSLVSVSVRVTVPLSGRGERMRASGLLQWVVRRHVYRHAS